MLYLNLESHGVRFVLPAAEIEGIVATAAIAAIHGPRSGLLGVMSAVGRDGIVPVFDLGLLTTDERCRDTLGTRIVVTWVVLQDTVALRVGIRAEGVVGLTKDLQRADQSNRGTEMLRDAQGEVYSRLRLDRLLSEQAKQFLVQEFMHG